MKEKLHDKLKVIFHTTHIFVFVGLVGFLFVIFFIFPAFFTSVSSYPPKEVTLAEKVNQVIKDNILPKDTGLPKLDKALYDKKMLELANNPPPKPPVTKKVKDLKTGVETTVTIEPKPVVHVWPVNNLPYPNDGAILPFKRIIAYYGNLYSKKMGVLGQYPKDEMFARLEAEVKKWEVADPETPVVPALHYIAVVAQGSAGADGKYRSRMPDSEIDKVISMASEINAIVFLDIQVGFSDVQSEIPRLEKYLKLPQVHLGLDPEFSMKSGIRPGKVVGTYDATDVNYAANYLANLVKQYNLPPKVLIVHRYTEKMLTNYKNIKPLPEVQILMHMDGWGGKSKKINTYQQFVATQPVQFTGFKLFYKNDVLDPGTTLLSPEELLKLNPRPSYIQFQ